MSNLIYDESGNVIGINNGSNDPFIYNTKTNSTTVYGENQTAPSMNQIMSYRYPLQGGNNHYVRFYINLNEESKLLSNFDRVIANKGYVDNTDQDRANKNTPSAKAITTGIETVGAIAATSLLGAAAVKSLLRPRIAIAAGAIGASAISSGAVSAGVKAVDSTIESIATETFRLTNRLKRLAANITLYTPANVRANYTMNYDMPEDLLVTLAQSENYENLKAGLESLGSPMVGETLGAFGRILASKNQTMSMLSRTAMNNKKDVMFKHVGNRVFQFEYNFAPKSAEEALAVHNIIYMFKYFAHPEMLPGYGNFLYLYPAEFDIEYGQVDSSELGSTTESTNPYLNKISSCVLENVSVNYGSGGSFQSLEKGEPVMTTLSLMFKEIETLHRDRIEAGY